jgi:hypothetical protein
MHGGKDWACRKAVALAMVVALGSACARGPRVDPAVVDSRDIPVYRVVAESLYLARAGGRAIALVNRTLDTACDRTSCLPIEKRWGLDSLWWAREDGALARAVRDALLARAGSSLTFGPGGTGNSLVVPVGPTAVPGTGADSSAWKAFQRATSAVAVLQFSPVGFSRDGSQALVVVRMLCGPGCGHLLGAALKRRGTAWAIGDVLLVSSDR